MQGSLYTNFIQERNFTGASSRCSSLFLQGEFEFRVKTPAIYSLHVMTRHDTRVYAYGRVCIAAAKKCKLLQADSIFSQGSGATASTHSSRRRVRRFNPPLQSSQYHSQDSCISSQQSVAATGDDGSVHTVLKGSLYTKFISERNFATVST